VRLDAGEARKESSRTSAQCSEADYEEDFFPTMSFDTTAMQNDSFEEKVALLAAPASRAPGSTARELTVVGSCDAHDTMSFGTKQFGGTPVIGASAEPALTFSREAPAVVGFGQHHDEVGASRVRRHAGHDDGEDYEGCGFEEYFGDDLEEDGLDVVSLSKQDIAQQLSEAQAALAMLQTCRLHEKNGRDFGELHSAAVALLLKARVGL